MGGRTVIIADTNILLRAVLNDDLEQAQAARQFLADAKSIAISLSSLCELVWVLRRIHKADLGQILRALEVLREDARVLCDREAIAAGVEFLKAGGDFADGVIEHEGRRLGGTVFATFDRKAAALMRKMGRESLLLSLN